MKAIIPAAGLGTRFLPATKAQPKEMLPVVDKPVIQYAVEEAAAAGCDDVLIITGRGKRAIEDHFDRSVELEEQLERGGKLDLLEEVLAIAKICQVYYVRQREPKGLGHAVLTGASHVRGESFYVLLGDVIVPGHGILPRLKEVHDRFGGSVVAVTPVSREDTGRYGVIAGEEIEPGVWRVTDLVEKPLPDEAPSNLAIFGRYLLTPAVMDVLPDIQPGAGGEIQLTDALRATLAREPIHAVVDDEPGFDTGTVLSWIEANVALALEDPELGPRLRASLGRMFHPKQQS